MKYCFFLISLVFTGLLWASIAHADGCDTLDNNPDWSIGIVQLHGSLRHYNYERALKITDELSKICARSPSLNFTIGKIYQKIGNNAKAIEYMQKATTYSKDFVVSQESLEQMWYARYEAERQELSDSELSIIRQQLNKTQNHYATALWTSIGIMSAGSILTCIGAGLFASNDAPMQFDTGKKKASVKTKTHIYTGLMAGGIGVTVTAAILTGIMGYHYVQSKKEEELSFMFSPMGAGFSFTF